MLKKEVKCTSSRSMDVLLPCLLGNYDRPTVQLSTNQPSDQQTDMRIHREVKLPINYYSLAEQKEFFSGCLCQS